MNIKCPFAAWLEDDDALREEVMKMTNRVLPDVRIHFSGTIRGFWECLSRFHPTVLVIDVMLPQVPGVTRLSEGVALAKWVRAGTIPALQGKYLSIPSEMQDLGDRYKTAPIQFITGRTEDRLQGELSEAGITEYALVEKGTDAQEGAIEVAIKFIRDAWQRCPQS